MTARGKLVSILDNLLALFTSPAMLQCINANALNLLSYFLFSKNKLMLSTAFQTP